MHAASLVDEHSETFGRLLQMAGSRTKPIPPEVLVRHIMTVTEGADWPVRVAAMAALLRRVRNAVGDGLVDDTGAGYLGTRQTRRKGKRNGTRPYSTVLHTIDPPVGSCDCPDFCKSSLGLCKHLLTTLSFIYDKPGRLARARAEQQERAVPSSRLFWDPIRPLTGSGDWLAQVRLTTGDEHSWVAPVLMHFTAMGKGGRALDPAGLEDPERRAKVVADLKAVLDSKAFLRAVADPDPAFAELLTAEPTARRPSLVPGALEEAMSSLKLQLYPYQAEAVQRFVEAGRLLLADDMGLGKTAQAVAIAHVLHRLGWANRGLVIVPASLKGQWGREWERFSDVPVEVVDGPAADRRALYEKSRTGFLVVNYELVLRDLDPLLALEPELVILDEAQRIKNWATKTARAMKQFVSPYRLVLTGTPMQNHLDELASVMEWVDERALEPRWRLVPWHTGHVGDGGRGLAAARNLNTLRARLSGSLLRRTRSDVLEQLPERTDTVLPVEMTPRQQEEHDSLEFPIRKLLAIGRKRPLTHEEFLRLMSLLNKQRMISNALANVEFDEVWPVLKRRPRPTRALLAGLESPKLVEFRELVRNLVLEQGRKMVVFSEWRRTLRLAEWAVRDLLTAEGLRAVFFTGAESRKLRDRSVVELCDDPSTTIMFLSDAGGVGLNLQRAASCCVNLELPWNPAVLEQRVGRIYRLGQSERVDVYNFVTTTGIEQRIARLVAGKRALFDAVFDGQTDEVQFSEHHSFLERLEREYVPPISAVDDDDVDDTIRIESVEMPNQGPEEISDDASEKSSNASSASPTPVAASPFERLRVERTADGGLRIEAPPEAAGELAKAFDTLATLFGSMAG